jgi:hypothetical protein
MATRLKGQEGTRMATMDWSHIRANKFSSERPTEWPEGVFAISMKGAALLGIHEKSGKLYWDGKEIVMRSAIRLGTFERWVASIAALGTFGSFAVNIGRAAGWWT